MNARSLDGEVKVSAVLPTFNRSAALRENLSSFLEIEHLGELIVVDDCSSDDTEAYLAGVDNPLLRIVKHSTNCGSPTARATGVSVARFPWILMLEDDVRVPLDYAKVLLEVAERMDASVAGAPWVHSSAERLDADVQRLQSLAVDRIGLDTHPSTFPMTDTDTPFLPAIVLVNRSFFEGVNYDPGYRGNAWREETSLYISAIELGYRCVLTPHTFSYQIQQWGGGQRRSRLAYEGWVFRNNWRFLRRHETFLREEGYIASVPLGQADFVMARLAGLVRGKLSSLKRRST
ncbi:glycosyltransferase family 2 protein [Demequina sp. SO4-13]|uniref:glycosyltransferase family 2 protein n=1 Tax=Demequina sp. SO4-13 TaxID=3401027 RepID=UPI003AF9F9B7